MANNTFPVPTYFAEATTIQQASRQANILKRVSDLFTDGGYTMKEEADGFFTVTAADGHSYRVDGIFDKCPCASFQNDGDCKHRIAVALEQAREAAQVAAFEEEEDGRLFIEACAAEHSTGYRF